MDDLEFRRTIYADPNCKDEGVRQAARDDSAKQDFWDELKQLDKQMQLAAKVAVPEGLAERLILRQSIDSHVQQQKKQARWYIALAASVAFIFGISLTLWQQQSRIDLGEHALAHVYYEEAYIQRASADIDLQQVNAKLADLGVSLSSEVGRILFANFCHFENIRSLHLVMQGEHGKVSVFVVPNKDEYRSIESFGDEKLHGEIYDYEKAILILVGDQGKSFDDVKTKLKEKLVFSA